MIKNSQIVTNCTKSLKPLAQSDSASCVLRRRKALQQTHADTQESCSTITNVYLRPRAASMRSCWGCSECVRTSCQVFYGRRPGTAVSRAAYCVGTTPHCRQRPVPIGIFRPTFGSRLLGIGARCRPRQRSHITRSNQDSQSSNSKRPRRGWPPWNWLEHVPSVPRLVFNLTALFLLMRIWPLSGRSPIGHPQAVSVPVPFSEFIQQAQSQQVVSVTVDNRSVKYILRPDSPVFADIPKTEEPVSVAFQTTRPADYAMPYDMLMAQNVQFGAVDSRNNTFLTVMVGFWSRLLFQSQVLSPKLFDIISVAVSPYLASGKQFIGWSAHDVRLQLCLFRCHHAQV